MTHQPNPTPRRYAAPKTPQRAGVEKLLHAQRTQGRPGLTVDELAKALDMPTAMVRVVIKNMYRTKRLAVEKNQRGQARYSVLNVASWTPLGPLSQPSAKLTQPQPGAAATTVYPKGLKPTLCPAPAYQPLAGYSTGQPVRPGAADHLQHPSRRGNQTAAYTGRAIAVI